MKRITYLILFLFIPFLIKAQLTEKLPIDPNLKFGKLENGLTYYIRKNTYPEKRAEFYIAQKVGSMQEEDDQRGLAHFLEHMAFNGTKNYPGRKSMTDYLEKIGAKFGANVNAYTSFDETVYNLSDIPVIRESIIDSCLLVLHDWSSFITLDDKEIDKERPIIKEEWRTRGNAQMRIWEEMFTRIYKDSKYAHRMPIGTIDIIENFKYQTIKDYYHKWYRPDLQAIIVVGDIDPIQIEAKIKTMFADIPKPLNPAKREYFPVPDNDSPIITTVTDPEAVNTMLTLYIKHDVIPSETLQTPQGLYIGIIKSLASQMLSDRLKELSQKKDAPFAGAYAYDNNFIVSKTKDAWTLSAACKDGKIKESFATLLRENLRLKKHGFTDAEIERAKASMLKNYEDAFNNRNKQPNSSYVREYVGNFTEDEPIPGIEFEYNFFKNMSQSMNADLFKQISTNIELYKNNIVTITGPQKEGLIYPTSDELLAVYKTVEEENIQPYIETISSEPLVAKLPKKGSIAKTETNIKLGSTLWTLSNGMKVVIKKTDFKDDEIVMSAMAYGGLSIAPDAEINNANFVSYVPSIGGIGNFSTTDLKKILAAKNAKVSPTISSWTQGFKGTASTKDLETLLQLTYLYFTAPRKDVEAYSSIIEAIKNQLKNLQSEPNYIFDEFSKNEMYGNNPRAKSIQYEDVDKLDYDKVINLYKEMYANPGTFVFTFTGTIDESKLKPLVEQYLAALPSGNKKASYKNVDLSLKKGLIIKQFNQTMKNPKSSVIDQYSGTIKRVQKNQMALSMLRQVLDMVYTETIREEEGGTYGVSTYVDCKRIPEGETVINMSFDTDPDKATKLNEIVHRELKKIAEQGPKDMDFKKAKEYMAKKHQEDVKTNAYWATILLTSGFYNQDYHSEYTSLLNSLTADDIKNITKDILSQGNVLKIIMSPKK